MSQPREIEAQGHEARAELRAHKRERILETATRLFYEHGYRATSMESIADELSATKPFIYYHFKNKYDILDAIVARVIERGIEALVGPAGADGPPATVLSSVVRSYATFVMEEQRLVAVFWREQSDFNADTRAKVEAQERELSDAIVRVLERGVASGDFSISSTRLTAMSILNLLSFTFTWYSDEGAMSADTIAEHFVRIVQRMVRSGVGPVL